MNAKKRNTIVREIFLEKVKQDPKCRLCGIRMATDPMHLIRRSYSTALITVAKNIEPGCRQCHDIFDNRPEMRKSLKGYKAFSDRIREMDEFYWFRNFSE